MSRRTTVISTSVAAGAVLAATLVPTAGADARHTTAARPAASRPAASRLAGATGSNGLPPWKKYRTTAFSYTAGQVCSFALTGTPVKDGEQSRTISTYPNGTPELVEYRGPLYVRYTNRSTGKSVVRNLSGYGFFQGYENGDLRLAVFLGNGGVGVKSPNVGYPVGYYVLHGKFIVQDDPKGNRRIVSVNAERENLCKTLA